jgi:hypothetical protein
MPDVADELRARLARYRSDARYGIENFFKIQDKRHRRVVPLRFNEAQIRLNSLRNEFIRRRKPIRIVACKARRAGISTGVEAFLFHDTINNAETDSLIVANQGRPSENVLKMCTTFWRYLPEKIAGVGFRPRFPPAYNNNPPKDRLEFPDLNSNIFIASARSIDQYLSFGFHNIHATEVAYYKDGIDLFRALSPTLTDDPMSMLVQESTPNGKSGIGRYFFEQVMQAKENGEQHNWESEATRLLFIPWTEMKLSFALPFENDHKRKAFAHSLTAEELDLTKRFEHLELEQLLWRRATLQKNPFNTDPDIFMQEYPTDIATAFLSSGSMVFGRKHILRLMSRVRDPVWRGDVYWGDDPEEARRNPHYAVRRPVVLDRGDAIAALRPSNTNDRTFNNLKVWKWPTVGDRLFVCGDVGGGDPDTRGGDYSVLAVCRMDDTLDGRDEVIMTWRGHLNPVLFGELASALCWWCLSKVGDDVRAPELCLEWNGPGVSANTVVDKLNLYNNTYRYVSPSVHGQPKTKHIGFESNSRTKPMMVSYTQRHIEMDRISVWDETFVEELSSYRKVDDYGDDNSYVGDAGMHDDCVTALEIGILRMRQEAGTNEIATVAYTDENLEHDTDKGDIAWDLFSERSLDLEMYDEDEGGGEEVAYWSGAA